MSKTKSTAAGKSSGAEQASAHPKYAVGRGRINMQMVQNVFLICLDSNIDDNSNNCRNTLAQLRRAINTINTFINVEE
jgi:hypothetical protein